MRVRNWMQPTGRYELASDNTAAMCPEAFAALEEANCGAAASYGDDEWTRRLGDLLREIFETDLEFFLVFNGTAANSLALAQLCQPFHSVVCHEHAHIETDECGAPGFFSGGVKLLLVGGAAGRIDLALAADVLDRQRELHSPKPRALSVTESTELGTVYAPGELHTVQEFAARRGLRIHMDGARFANAIASLDCAPKTITWQAGVDVLCLGGTKNGAALGELVIFFNRELAGEFEYRCKQAGQLGSKMRFLAAPWVGLLRDGHWLRYARHANASAARLERALREFRAVEFVFPVQANAVFVRMAEPLFHALHQRGWHFYKFINPDVYRLMCSWAVADRAIDDFIADLRLCAADGQLR